MLTKRHGLAALGGVAMVASWFTHGLLRLVLWVVFAALTLWASRLARGDGQRE